MDVYMNGQRRGDWYTKNELLSHKERIKMLAICSIMDGLGEYYARWNKSDREKQILHDITYVESKKHDKLVNIIKKKQTHRYREQTSGQQCWEQEGVRWSIGVGD